MKRKLFRVLAAFYMLLFLGFIIAPLFFVVVNSFNQAKFSLVPPPGFSLQWYGRLLTLPDFILAFKNSVLVALASAAIGLAAGTAAALAIVRGAWKPAGLLQSILLSPLLVPRIIVGIAVFIAAVRAGLYPSMISLILAHSVLVLPYVVSIVVANLQQVQRAQEEAARDLGANVWQAFRLATVPQIARGLLVAAIFAFVLSFDEFDLSLFLTRSETMTLPIRMYLYMQEFEDPTLAALSTLLIGLSIVAVAATGWLMRDASLSQVFGRRL
jgi:ABC-type spermidine/putrescine transport system permease subunit II